MASDDDLLREARELYDDDIEADRKNRDEAAADLRMYGGEQWRAEDVDARGKAGRPCLTINRFPQYVHQITNDARIKPPSIGVRPVDDGADQKIAEIYTGLVRNIEQTSQAEASYIRALEHAAICGMGHWRVDTQYADDDAFDLDIVIKGIRSPFAVVWDGGAKEQTRADATHVFVTDMLTKREFKRQYPKATPDDWGRDDGASKAWLERGGDFIRIAEYWYRKATTKTVLRLVSGEVVDPARLGEDAVAEARAKGFIDREREIDTFEIWQVMMTGGELLTKPQRWAGRMFPIVPVLGEEVDLGEYTVRRGIVRGGRDAQRMFNLHRSALAESAGMAPKAKWLATPEQIAGFEQYWARANTGDFAYLPYNPDPQAGGPPQRVAPDIPSQALLNEVAMAAQDMESAIGIFRAGLGQESNEKSGKAIIARQREGDVGSYHYIDNLGRAIMQTGRILVDLIPRIYDTERVVRTLGEDGSEEVVHVNVPGADGRKVHDLAVGKYDVVVTVAPSYSTKREEARESMLAMTQAYPQVMASAADLIIEEMDWPGADKIAARVRRQLGPQIAEPKEGDPPPIQTPPPPEMVLAQAEMVKAQAQAQKAQQEVELKKVELAIEAEKARQAGVKIEDQGNAAAVDASVKLMNAAKPQPAPAGAFAG